MEATLSSDARSRADQCLALAGISDKEVLGNLSISEVSNLLRGETFGTDTWDAILEIREMAVAFCDEEIRKSSKGLLSTLRTEPPNRSPNRAKL